MRYLSRCYLLIIFAFLYTPLLVLVTFSFNKARYAMTWHGFTLHWYQKLLHDSVLIRAAWHSLLLASLTALLTVLLASIITTALLRYRFAGKRVLHNLIIVLIVMPDLILGVGLLIVFSAMHLSLGFTSLLLAHITISLPFAILTINSRAVDLDPYLFDAAQDSGASERQIYWRILLPQLKPALLAAGLLSFAISLDDIMVSFFVSGPAFSILPIQIYSLTKTGVTPEINALCAVMLGVIFLVMASFQRIQKS